MRKFFALLTVLSLVLMTGSVLGAEVAPRPFTPVQNGYVESAPMMQAWAPDHLMVQFTVDGFERASLPSPGDKSVISRTGLASLDQALAADGVTGLRAAFPIMANKAMARDLGVNRWYIVDLAPGADIPAVAQRLTNDPNVAIAEPDLVAFPAVIPNDPMYSNNWGHNNTVQLPGFDWGGTWDHTLAGVGTPSADTNAQAAWNGTQGYGSSSVVVAILDSGVDAGHPDLLQVTGYDFGDNDNNPTDDSSAPGHGTACAGVTAGIANNGTGVTGIAGGVSIMPVKIANSAGSLLFSAIANGVYYAADNGADVISMSFGAATTSSATVDPALTYAYNQGVTLLAATGNSNNSQIEYPAYHDRVIGVGAASPDGDRKRSSDNTADLNPGINADPNGYTVDGERWWGSSYGGTTQDHRGAVDIIAPTIMPTTDIQGSGGYDPSDYSSFFNGTSCATPYAAGVCALIISANPSFSPAQVWAQLTGTAQDVVNVESGVGWDRYSGYGMVDAAAAVGEIVPPDVLAEFTADVTSGCAPFTVTFTDQSIGNPDTWTWFFGDSSFSGDQNPVHTYTAPGVYDVSLAIQTSEGDADVMKLGYIVVSGPPTVSFTNSASFVPAGTGVDFTDTSTGDPVGWVWDFGDGGSSTDQNPTHFFNTPGVFHVELLAANTCGADSLTVTNSVIVGLPALPVAGFSFPPSDGCAPVSVDFTDESTGLIDSWAWNFGDGATATEASPNHIFTMPGTYDVQLIVTNLAGSDTTTAIAAVTVDGPPTVAWTVSSTDIDIGDSVTFTDTSTGSPTTWAWDFGDGGTSADQNPVYQYTMGGVYTVALIATNACGPDTLTVVDQITVASVAVPVAMFTHTPLFGCAPLEVTFTDESLNDFNAWQWDFGDGNQDAVQNPVHTYTTPGTYDVRLIISGTAGSDTLTVGGAVVVGVPIAAAFAVSDTLGAPSLAVTFTDASTGDPVAWAWDFGDGNTDDVANPAHSYTAEGIYDVTLIVTNACSTDTLTMVSAVQVSSASAVGDMIAARFGLDQNYPNPFNPSTTIVYGLQKPGHARLEIFDTSGRRVATLVNGDKAAGRHEIVWRPLDLASGIYFSRLTVGDQTATKRVTLLK